MTDFMHKHHDDSDNNAELSEAGRARRDTILQIATGQMTEHRRHLQRRRRIVATGAMSMVLVLVAVIAVTSQQPEASPNIVVRPLIPAPPPQNIVGETTAVDRRIVRSDERIIDRYRVHTPPHTIELTDDELVDWLADVDRPTGLISIDGQVRLTNHVTDLPANENGDDSIESPPL